VKHIYSGKIRELYENDDGTLLMVASDRISAFDYVLPTPIPGKGKILTQLSLWWSEQLADIVPSHLLDAAVPAEFAGRAVTCRKLAMVPVECVARGYLTGSGLADYRSDGALYGQPLPGGLTDGSRLPAPVFDPDAKGQAGDHDQNLTPAELEALVGADVAGELERITLAVYQRGAELAAARGIIVADTKIELGFDADGTLRLGDEVLTPDSSRFWPADAWQPGQRQPSFDKQYVRDWLTSPASGWDRNGSQPPPPLPDEVVQQTRATYIAAYERLTGLDWRE
jgi:phosphoribosylaminoimidazole-succinocarboxamide synthase